MDWDWLDSGREVKVLSALGIVTFYLYHINITILIVHSMFQSKMNLDHSGFVIKETQHQEAQWSHCFLHQQAHC